MGCLAHRGFIQFLVDGATDDRTPREELGYRFEYVDGELPEGLTITTAAYLRPPTGELYLVWNDGATWEQDAFLFRVAVIAIDRAGNESARSNILIVGNDGDMDYEHRLAIGAYSSVSDRIARDLATVHLNTHVAATLDTVRVLASNPLPKPPAAISEVFDDATLRCVEALQRVRIDRIAFRQDHVAGEVPFELDPYTLVESGRELSKDEVLQLRGLLADPHSYISDKWACMFEVEYAFSAGDGPRKTYITTGTSCHLVGIKCSAAGQSGNLTREAAALMRAFCQGLFRFPPTD